MKINAALAGAFLIGMALPAVAQTTTTTSSYYVVQDVKTKKCTIMDKKPPATEYTTVGTMAWSIRPASRPRTR